MIILGAHIAGLLGFFSIGLALMVLGRLSQRLGRESNANPYYLGHYLAAVLVWGGMGARLYFLTRGLPDISATDGNLVYILLNDGLPALGITVGLLATWYYWSWLLAERD